MEAAKFLGLENVPALRLSHLTATEKRGYAIADNRIGEKSGWNRKLLAIELQSLIDLDFEVELTGFELGEINVILDDTDMAKPEIAGSKNEEVVRSPSGPTVSQAGDLWLLDNHRLLCGEGCDGIDVAIKRWQSHSGKAAILAASGRTFAEIEEERRKFASSLVGIDQPNMTPVGIAR